MTSPFHQDQPDRPERPAGETEEARIAKALAHPLRARILARLGERVMAPGDLAVELGAPLGVVSYHVRMLRDYDVIELVRTEPRRGALQHFYKATARPNLDQDQWRTLPASVRQTVIGETFGKISEGVAAGADAGVTVDVTLTEVELDERAVRKLEKLTGDYIGKVAALSEETEGRRARGLATGRWGIGLATFARPEAGEGGA